MNSNDSSRIDGSTDRSEGVNLVAGDDIAPPGKRTVTGDGRPDSSGDENTTYGRLTPTETFSAISDDDTTEPSESTSESVQISEMNSNIVNKGKKIWMKAGVTKKEPRVGTDFQVDL